MRKNIIISVIIYVPRYDLEENYFFNIISLFSTTRNLAVDWTSLRFIFFIIIAEPRGSPPCKNNRK